MVDDLERRGIRPPLLDAMARVRREAFLSPELADRAYDDAPLPIGGRQTVSQPFIVAFTAQALGLEGGERVLDVGTGSGYGAAVLAELGCEVFTIERIERLAGRAARSLALEGYDDVRLRIGDGSLGWPDEAPFDAIVVAAASAKVPGALLAQLAEGGRLVLPVGDTVDEQELVRVEIRGGRLHAEALAAVRFVPLVESG